VRRLHEEHGAVLPLIGFMLAVLMGLAAFATDLGWFYLNANRIQRAADAAALAGVIYMPDKFDTDASDTALQVAAANGFTDGVSGVVVTPSKVQDASGPDSPFELKVTISVDVPTFFLKVFGEEAQTITRTATAEYLPPLPMGSPGSTFGNDPAGGSWVGFWANIHGTYTDTKYGDAYSSWCPDKSGSGFGCASLPNPSWRDRGYLYGVDVPAGTTSFTVSTLDLALHTPGGDHKRTGDHNTCVGCGGDGHTVVATLYYPDPTPLDVSDNVPVGGCTVVKPPEPELSASAPYTWEVLCTVTSPAPGIYPLEIKVDTPKKKDDTGLNRYSLKVAGTGTTPRLYALGDMSIFNNITGSTSDFYLAEVDSAYRGKTFVVELYDPGDADYYVSNIISFLGPDGTTWIDGCTISTRDEVTDSWHSLTTHSAGDPCTLDATRPAHNYDGKWLQVQFQLPATYAGGWWKVHYDYGATTQDTTTWRAYIIGSPLHLVLGQ
jgi:Flp pilus assembly protein TadG